MNVPTTMEIAVIPVVTQPVATFVAVPLGIYWTQQASAVKVCVGIAFM